MTTSLDGAKHDLLAKARKLPGMKAAPERPPESPNVFPFAVCYDRLGDMEIIAAGPGGAAYHVATLYLELHVSRQMLPAAIDLAARLRDPMLRALVADPTLGGNADNVNAIHWEFGRMGWGGVETLGYRFSIEVKVRLTVPA
jgi:hypothetical protein